MPNELLQKIISQNNVQKLQKYIKNHLPNNPQNLQRIYKQLQLFSSNLNQIIEGNKQASSGYRPNQTLRNQIHQQYIKNDLLKKTTNMFLKRHSSLKTIQPSNNKKSSDYFQRNKQQNITKRQQILVRNLKQKGLKPSSIQLPLGMQVLQRQQNRLVKPLQSNKNIIFKENTKMNTCIKKFNINKRFYQNNLEDGHIDEEKYYDREMKAFLDRRKQSLTQITEKRQFADYGKIGRQKRFSHVQSKVFANTQMSLGLQTNRNLQNVKTFRTEMSLSSKLDPNTNLQRKMSEKTCQYLKDKGLQTRQLINYCTQSLQQVQDHKAKSLMSQNKKYKKIRQQNQQLVGTLKNMYRKLEQQKQQLGDNSEQMKQLGKMYGKSKLIQKYTLNYLKSIKTKVRNDIILSNRNDLIKNQSKFRNLIAQHVN